MVIMVAYNCKDKGENVLAHQHVYLPMASHELRTEKEMIQ